MKSITDKLNDVIGTNEIDEIKEYLGLSHRHYGSGEGLCPDEEETPEYKRLRALEKKWDPIDLSSVFINEINQLREILRAVVPLVEALNKYGNPQNWRYKDNGDVGAFDAWLDFKLGHYSKTHNDIGIYIAKDALTALETKLDEMGKP